MSRSSEVSQIRSGSVALPVCGSTIWSNVFSQGIHQGTSSRYGSPSRPGHSYHALPRRPSNQVSDCRAVQQGHQCRDPDTGSVWVGCELRKVQPVTIKINLFFRDATGHSESQGLPPISQGQDSACRYPGPAASQETFHPSGDESTRLDGVINGSGPVCAVPHQATTVGPPITVEPVIPVTGQDVPADSASSILPGMVAEVPYSASRQVLPSCEMDCDILRRQSCGVGSSLGASHGARALVSPRDTVAYQSIGTQSDFPISQTLVSRPKKPSNTDSVRQRHSGRLHKSPGRHQECSSLKGGLSDPPVGRKVGTNPVRSIHSRKGECGGRLPESAESRPRGVGSKPGSVRADLSDVGQSQHRPVCNKGKQKGKLLHVSLPGSASSRSGCPSGSMDGFSAALCLPSSSAPAKTAKKDKIRKGYSNPDSALLAKTGLVPGSLAHGPCRSLATTSTAGPSIPRSSAPSEFTVSKFDGMAVETRVLQDLGLIPEVINTLIKARKTSSSKVYYRTWRAYFRWCEERKYPVRQYSLGRLLAFLQTGLDSGLTLSTLKGQASAFAILFQRSIATKPLVRTFFKGVLHVRPPIRNPVSPWDLNLVLSALQDPPFEPLGGIPLMSLTLKVVFLVAITSIRRVSELAALSCKPPYLVFHKDKVVLNLPPEFLPKVVSAFHLNEEIVLPSFCPKPSHPVERRLHSLDVVRALKFYYQATEGIRKTDSLFVIPDGPRKGLPATKATISRWIRQVIVKAYTSKNLAPPIKVTAHSTRAVGSSWAFRHQASVEQVCKAATWSSVHTFMKFYKLDVAASSDASLGRIILQAAV